MRSNVYFTSFAVSTAPLWNFTPSFSVQLRVTPSLSKRGTSVRRTGSSLFSSFQRNKDSQIESAIEAESELLERCISIGCFALAKPKRRIFFLEELSEFEAPPQALSIAEAAMPPTETADALRKLRREICVIVVSPFLKLVGSCSSMARALLALRHARTHAQSSVSTMT